MNDPLGIDAGKLGAVNDIDLKNEYASIPDQSLEAMTDRVQPRQVSSGTSRGTQTIVNTDGSYVTLGLIPGTTDFGIAFYDASDTLISKITGSTYYFYDKANGSKNIIQIGKLPDSSYGQVVAKSGFNVSEIFT